VRFAREAGLPLSVRGGGHHACGFSLADAGLVVDTSDMKGIAFDGATATVVAEPGCGWRDVDRVTYQEHGLADPGGECPTVSNAGYSLGGGFGFLSRTNGLACDHILEAEVVDAEGNVLRVNDHEHPDLYWALRGAGGAGLGVVTNLKYRLNRCPRRCSARCWRGPSTTRPRRSLPTATSTKDARRTGCRSISRW